MEAIDTVTPASAAFLYTREGDVMLQHGGICTRITFDRVEQTDLSTFLSEIVPRMKRDASNLTIIRNPTRGEYTFVLGDAVTIYKVNAIEDVGIADMIERLTIKKAQSVYIPDIPYQIIADVQDEQLRKITVRIPEHKSVYRCSDLQLNEKVYIPPLWAKVTLNRANMPTNLQLAVEAERNPMSMATTLYGWPFTNAWSEDGKCCLGNTSLSVAKTQLTIGEAIQVTLQRFIESDSNPHLIPHYAADAEKRMLSMYAELKDKAKFDKLLKAYSNSKDACTLVRSVAIHTEKGAYRTFPYLKLKVGAETFIR